MGKDDLCNESNDLTSHHFLSSHVCDLATNVDYKRIKRLEKQEARHCPAVEMHYAKSYRPFELFVNEKL